MGKNFCQQVFARAKLDWRFKLNTKTKFIAYTGVMTAFVFGLLLLETQVLNGILPVTPCYLSLPIAISLSVSHKNVKNMFVGGAIFGICSFVMSFMFGQVWFSNPLISVLPRVLFGVTSTLTYIGVSKLTKNSKSKFVNRVLPASISGMVGAMTNTVLVVLSFFIWGWQDLQQAITTIISFNALIEIVCSIFLVPVFVGVTRKYYGLDRVDEKGDENASCD